MKRTSVRLSVRPRFFVLLAILILCVATPVICLTLRDREYTVRTAQVTQTVECEAVVVRDETVVAAQQTGQIDNLIAEGDAVQKGDAVVKVYSAQYSAAAISQLAALRDEILSYQRNNILGDILDADLSAMDAQIAEKTALLPEAVTDRDTTTIKQLESEIDALMRQRSEYLRRNYRVDEKLSEMLEQETALTEQIDSWTTTVETPLSGRVSFSVDGCEHVLNADALEQLTPEQLKTTVADADMQRVTQATEYTSLFRVVDTDGWYCVFAAQQDLEIVPGQTYTVQIVGQDSASYTASALENETFAQNGMTVLYIKEDPQSVLNLRNVQIRIDKEFEGLCVPRRALYEKDGQPGVYHLEGEDRIFVPVTVLARDRDDVVVLSSQLRVGDRILLK